MRRREFIAGTMALLAATPAFAAYRSTRLSVTISGEGRDVILIPGLTSPRTVWNGLVSAVPGYRYHLVQVAGFAGDAVGGNAAGPVLEPLAAEIARYILESGSRRPAIVGHSMGGTIAMMLAAEHGALVGRIMVVDMLPAPAGMFGATAADAQPLADLLLGALTSTTTGQQLLQSLVGGGSPGMARSDPNLVARVTHELAITDLTSDLAKIRVPMTVVYATPPPNRTFDPAAVTRAYQIAYRNAPTAKLVRVPDSGHMIMLDQPLRFQAAVRDFLQ